MLQSNAVGASQGVADDAGRDNAAPIGQRRNRLRVIPQVLVSAEDSLSRVQIAVQAHAELILTGPLIPDEDIVIGRRLLPIDEHIGCGIAVHHVSDGRVEAVQGDCVVGKPVADES